MSVRADNQHHDVCHITGKRKYRTQAKAHTFLARIAKKNKRHGDSCTIHVYQCPHCQYFHIGHKAAEAYVQAPPKRRKVGRRAPMNATERAIEHIARLWMLGEMRRLCAANDEGPTNEPRAA